VLPSAESALFNASLCELLAGEQKRGAFEMLRQKFPGSPKVGMVKIQEALFLARMRDPRAVGILQELGAGTDSGLAGSAALALAEWNYQHEDNGEAEGELRRISSGNITETAQADALSVFLADDGGDGDAAIKAAEKFLAEHAGSPSEAEVRMKLGELTSGGETLPAQGYNSSRWPENFPALRREMPALFLAAQAAARLQTPASANDAMILRAGAPQQMGRFPRERGSSQAILQSAFGKRSEAIVIFDSILAAGPDSEIRAAALMEKAKALLASSDSASNAAALRILKGLSGRPDASVVLANPGTRSHRSGLQTLGDADSAVAAYYDVLKESEAGSAEYFWFYKAGFAAARLLESEKRWDQAIRVYEMISAANGPRSQEAASRINKIRLENFLWENEPEN